MNPLLVMAIGLGVVFVGLLCLIGIIYLMSFLFRLFSGERKLRALESKRADLSELISQEGQGSASLAPAMPTGEQRRRLVAAVSVAVAEYMGTEPSALRIHSIKRVGAGSEGMDQSARRELIAAVSAAIATQLDTDVSGIRIHSIKRV